MVIDNLSWCKPLISKDGRVALIRNEGRTTELYIDGEDVDVNDGNIDRAARIAAGESCEDGYIYDEDDLLWSCEEAACWQCPAYAECECWENEEDEEDE